MDEQIARILVWLRRRSFFRAVQRTFVMLMPLATIGAYFQLLKDSIFSPNSLIYNIFNFDYVMSDQVWNAGYAISTGMVAVTFGLFGLYAAFFTAAYTARLYHKDSMMSGTTAIVVTMFCAYFNAQNSHAAGANIFASRVLNINGVLLALVLGYCVGQIFHWLGKDYAPVGVEHVTQIRRRIWRAFLPTIVAVSFGFLLGISIYLFNVHLLESSSYRGMIQSLQDSNNLVVIVLFTVFDSLLEWLGFGYPLRSLLTGSRNGAALVNLNYALRHGSAAHVPYPYLGSSLVLAYGLMGTASIALALTVALLLYERHTANEAVARVNLLAVAFNSNAGLTIGLPIVLNPLYLVPLLTIPAVNELLAALMIKWQVIVPSVYPVLKGTPGMLIAFLGSNGNRYSLTFSLLLFVLDVLMMIPIVQIERQVRNRLRAFNEEDDLHA